jgi:DeoR family fructose operon transcriptional repressor
MCSVDELSKLVNVSDTTVYRDLISLKNTGFILKVHGGAIWAEDNIESDNKVEHRINVRLRKEVEEKAEIGKKAAQLIGDETSIFLDHHRHVFILPELPNENINI